MGWRVVNYQLMLLSWIKMNSNLKLNEDLKKNYNEDSNIGSFLKADVEYHKQLHKLYNNLSFLPETMIGNKCEKLMCNLKNKKRTCCIHKSFGTITKLTISIAKST